MRPETAGHVVGRWGSRHLAHVDARQSRVPLHPAQSEGQAAIPSNFTHPTFRNPRTGIPSLEAHLNRCNEIRSAEHLNALEPTLVDEDPVAIDEVLEEQ